MLFDNTIHEPEFLGEAFSLLAKSEDQADCQSCELLKSIHRFCQRSKMLENLPYTRVAFSNIFRKLSSRFGPISFGMNFKVLQYFCIDFSAVQGFELEKIVVGIISSSASKLGSFCEYRRTNDVKQRKQKTESNSTPK